MVDSKRNLMCFSGTDQSTRIDGNLQGQTASTGGSHSSICYLWLPGAIALAEVQRLFV